MTILGIDPGYDRLGWGVVSVSLNKPFFVAADLISTTKDDLPAYRLRSLYEQLIQLHETYKPNVVVTESVFLTSNQKTVIGVAQAKGVVLLTAALYGCQVHEYSPVQMKAIVAGNGRSDKKTVEKMLRLQLSSIPLKVIDDTIDGIALAFAHAVSIR